jgi:hypothetical protein
MPVTPLRKVSRECWTDLAPHRSDFDAIVVPGDMHGAPLGGVIAEALDVPLMVVCTRRHFCVVSHIVTIGDVRPDARLLYVDDWMWGGASLHRTLRALRTRRFFRYLNQSEKSPVVAAYATATRKYTEVTR